MKTNKDLLAFKAAMRDMRSERVNTECFNVRKYENSLRPGEISGKTLNGKVIF